MKKLFTILLTLVLASTMVVPAAASSTTLTIEYTRVGADYTLVVPQDQTITNDEFADIGMVTLEDTTNFQARYLMVTAEMGNFVGKERNVEVPGFLRIKSGEDVLGESNKHTFYFREVNEDGSLGNDAYDEYNNKVEQLAVACYLDGNYAPTDTYTATIDYTASVEYVTAA